MSDELCDVLTKQAMADKRMPKGRVVTHANPWSVVKRGSRWAVVKNSTGAVKAMHDSKEKAMAQLRLLEGVEHGWKPTRNR